MKSFKIIGLVLAIFGIVMYFTQVVEGYDTLFGALAGIGTGLFFIGIGTKKVNQ